MRNPSFAIAVVLIVVAAWVANGVGQERTSNSEPPAGEDIGRAKDDIAGLPRQIRMRMRLTHQRLLRRDTSKTTQELQEGILRDLKTWVANQEGGKKSPSTAPAKPADGAKSPRGAARGGPQSPGQDEGPKSTGRSDLRRIWGQLPTQVRDRMRGLNPERFVPKYRGTLGDFYKKLAKRVVDTP